MKKMKKNYLSLLYPEDIKEKSGKVLSSCEIV